MSQVSLKLVSTCCKCASFLNCLHYSPQWYIHISINKKKQNPLKAMHVINISANTPEIALVSYWVTYTVVFKILLLVYKALHGLSRSFLSFVFYTRIFPTSWYKNLRYSLKSLFNISTRNNYYTIYGERAFSFVAEPILWNLFLSRNVKWRC